MGNSLGPVLFITAGIGLGYLVITGRVSNLVGLFTGNAPAPVATKNTPDASAVNAATMTSF